MIPEEIRREIINLMRGATFVAGQVTLTNASSTTSVSRDGISTTSIISLTPYTSAARAEGIPQCVPAAGAFTLTHNSNSSTRTYAYVVHTPQ